MYSYLKITFIEKPFDIIWKLAQEARKCKPANKNRQQANLLPVLSPSPNCDIGRTFTHIFFLNSKKFHTKSVNHFYKNPIFLAKEYRRIIDTGEAKNQTDLAQKLGISKVRVCQVLSMLKLSTKLIDAIEKIGNPMPSRIVTERMLLNCLNSPELYKSVQSCLNSYMR